MSQLSKEEQQKHCRNLARTDLYFLLRYGLNRPDVEHPWIFDRCKEVYEQPNGFLDLWAREHYKSTIITFAKLIQDLLASHGENALDEWQGREATIGIFSHTRPSAKGFLRQIMRELESNELLKEWFPDVLWKEPKKSAPKWSEDDGIILKRNTNPKECSVEAWGLVDGQPTGKHFVIRNYDDVVTLENARSAEMIRKTTEAWEISLNLGVDGGFERYVGTFYADGDTYHEIIERDVLTPRIYPGSKDGTATGEPVYWSQETFDRKRKAMGPHTFSTQILLDPIPAEDAYFKYDWFRWYEEVPKHINTFGASDYAVTDGDGDATEHGVAGVDPDDNLYILDWWSGHTTADVWIEEQLDFIDDYEPWLWVGESGPIRRAVEPFLSKRMNERKSFCRLEWLPSVHDKPTRCRSFQARAASGKVYLPKNKPWADELVKQLLRFPISKRDDKVDVCSLFGRILDQMHAAIKPKVYKQPEIKGVESMSLDEMIKLSEEESDYDMRERI